MRHHALPAWSTRGRRARARGRARPGPVGRRTKVQRGVVSLAPRWRGICALSESASTRTASPRDRALRRRTRRTSRGAGAAASSRDSASRARRSPRPTPRSGRGRTRRRASARPAAAAGGAARSASARAPKSSPASPPPGGGAPTPQGVRRRRTSSSIASPPDSPRRRAHDRFDRSCAHHAPARARARVAPAAGAATAREPRKPAQPPIARESATRSERAASARSFVVTVETGGLRIMSSALRDKGRANQTRAPFRSVFPARAPHLVQRQVKSSSEVSEGKLSTRPGSRGETASESRRSARKLSSSSSPPPPPQGARVTTRLRYARNPIGYTSVASRARPRSTSKLNRTRASARRAVAAGAASSNASHSSRHPRRRRRAAAAGPLSGRQRPREGHPQGARAGSAQGETRRHPRRAARRVAAAAPGRAAARSAVVGAVVAAVSVIAAVAVVAGPADRVRKEPTPVAACGPEARSNQYARSAATARCESRHVSARRRGDRVARGSTPADEPGHHRAARRPPVLASPSVVSLSSAASPRTPRAGARPRDSRPTRCRPLSSRSQGGGARGRCCRAAGPADPLIRRCRPPSRPSSSTARSSSRSTSACCCPRAQEAEGRPLPTAGRARRG